MTLLLQHCTVIVTDAQGWFKKDLSDKTQSINVPNYTSIVLKITKGVPQGAILVPFQFSIFINHKRRNNQPAKIHLFADETVTTSKLPFTNCSYHFTD